MILPKGYFFIGIGSLYFTFFIYRLLKILIKQSLSFWLLPLLYLLVFLISLPAVNFLDIKAVIYYHVLAVSLFLEIIYVFVRKFEVVKYIIPTGLACFITVSCIFAYGYYNMHHIVVTRYVLDSEKISDLRIAVIADLHMGVSMNIDDLQKVCRDIDDEKVDIVVLDGDIFDENTSYELMKKTCRVLGSMANTKGIYYVYGNHDQNLYAGNPQYQGDDIRNEFEKYGVTVLDDEISVVEDVMIIGRGDARFYNDGSRLMMEDLYNDRNDEYYTIVLDHQPLDLELNAKLGCDLQISGHTHGGQLFPQGIVQSLTSDTLVYGKREIGDFTAITTSGIAGWKYPIKTGAPSEYLIIDIC